VPLHLHERCAAPHVIRPSLAIALRCIRVAKPVAPHACTARTARRWLGRCGGRFFGRGRGGGRLVDGLDFWLCLLLNLCLAVRRCWRCTFRLLHDCNVSAIAKLLSSTARAPLRGTVTLSAKGTTPRRLVPTFIGEVSPIASCVRSWEATVRGEPLPLQGTGRAPQVCWDGVLHAVEASLSHRREVPTLGMSRVKRLAVFTGIAHHATCGERCAT